MAIRVIPSLGREVSESHIEKYYENSIIKSFRDLEENGNVKKYGYSELDSIDAEGYPFASDRDENGNLQFFFVPNAHEICVGTTGSGKTTGCVLPRIRALAAKKNRPCFFITDPKGEVFRNTAKYIKNKGYRVFLINFKDVTHSDCWNPFAEIYDSWMRQSDAAFKVVYHSDDSIADYQMQDSPEYFNRNGEFWSIGNRAFPSEEAVDRYVAFYKSVVLSETEDSIHQLVHTLIPNTTVSKIDPSWMMGAQEILKGIIYVMLEDALDERSGFTKENMTLMTVREYYDIIRDEVVDLQNNRINPLLRTKKLLHKKLTNQSIKHMKAYFENAPTTTRSYLGCFENAMQEWFNPKIYTVCNGNTIDLNAIGDEPFAIYLVTRDYEKSDFTVAGMFIDWVYKKMLEKAEAAGGTLAREMFFMLDEFGNVPAIMDFENKIATSRSRNIWFHMFVQSYAQIETVYDQDGKKRSQIIRDNCNAHTFLGSQNYDTKNTFSRECGKRVVPKLSSAINPDDKQVLEIPVLPISALELLEPGQMYMRKTGFPLINTQFERSYACSELMTDNDATPEELHIEALPFNSEKYHYRYLSSHDSMAEFARTHTDKHESAEINIVPEFLKPF